LAGAGDVNQLVCDRPTRRYFFAGIQVKDSISQFPWQGVAAATSKLPQKERSDVFTYPVADASLLAGTTIKAKHATRIGAVCGRAPVVSLPEKSAT